MNYLHACGIKVLLVVKKTPLCILNKGCEHFVYQRSEHALIVPPVERTSLMMFVTSSPTGVMSPSGINCYHCHCQIVSSHWQCLWVPRFILVLHVSCVVRITDMNSCNLADLCKTSTWTVHGAILKCICRESNSKAKQMCVYYCESIVWMGVFFVFTASRCTSKHTSHFNEILRAQASTRSVPEAPPGRQQPTCWDQDGRSLSDSSDCGGRKHPGGTKGDAAVGRKGSGGSARESHWPLLCHCVYTDTHTLKTLSTHNTAGGNLPPAVLFLNSRSIRRSPGM